MFIHESHIRPIYCGRHGTFLYRSLFIVFFGKSKQLFSRVERLGNDVKFCRAVKYQRSDSGGISSAKFYILSCVENYFDGDTSLI